MTARGKRKAPVLWVVLSTDSGGYERAREIGRTRDYTRGLLELCRHQDRFARSWRMVRYEPAKARGRGRK